MTESEIAAVRKLFDAGLCNIYDTLPMAIDSTLEVIGTMRYRLKTAHHVDALACPMRSRIEALEKIREAGL